MAKAKPAVHWTNLPEEGARMGGEQVAYSKYLESVPDMITIK